METFTLAYLLSMLNRIFEPNYIYFGCFIFEIWSTENVKMVKNPIFQGPVAKKGGMNFFFIFGPDVELDVLYKINVI